MKRGDYMNEELKSLLYRIAEEALQPNQYNRAMLEIDRTDLSFKELEEKKNMLCQQLEQLEDMNLIRVISDPGIYMNVELLTAGELYINNKRSN